MIKLDKRIQALENAGIDTSKYNLEVGKKKKTQSVSAKADETVENVQIKNKLFRRWVMAQTFKMIYTPTTPKKTKNVAEPEIGWEAYLKNKYSYYYQFSVMEEEMKALKRIEKQDPEEFKIRSKFFTKQVVIQTCEDFVNRYQKKFGKFRRDKRIVVIKLKNVIQKMKEDSKYSSFYFDYTEFRKLQKELKYHLPHETPKDKCWKDAYKGEGAYYTLQNMILYHNCNLKDCNTTEESLAKLESCLNEYTQIPMDKWRLHSLLKETIKINDFDLRKSLCNKA